MNSQKCLELDPQQLDSIDLSLDFDGLIFDCDGTLSDSMPLHYVAWRETMQSYGIEFPEDRFYAMGGMPTGQIIGILGGEQHVAVDADEAAARKEAAFENMISLLKPINIVCQIARRHADRMPIAVASGGIAPIIRKQLQQLELHDIFSVIVTAEDTARHKPHPDVFLEAAARLNVEPTRCLVFEDADLGFQAARAAKMAYVDVRPLYCSSTTLR